MTSKTILYRTKSDIRILSALLEKEPDLLTIKELAEKVGSSIPRTRVNVKKLIKEGFVIEIQHPKQFFYKINLENFLIIEFAKVYYMEKFISINEKLKDLPSFIGIYYPYFLQDVLLVPILFGSCISEKEFGDIDIALILNYVTPDIKSKIISKTVMLEQKINHKISIEVYDKKTFEGMLITGNNIAFNMIKSGVPLFCLYSKTDFIDEFVKLKMRRQFCERYKEIMKIIMDIETAEENKDFSVLRRGVTEFFYYVLGTKNVIPANDYEARKMFGSSFPKTYKKIQSYLSKKNFKGILYIISNYSFNWVLK